MKAQLASVAFCLVALCCTTSAQTCPIAVDINTHGEAASSQVHSGTAGTHGSSSRAFPNLGGQWFFGAKVAFGSYQLFSTDLTAAGTKIVKDISPAGFISEICVSGGQVFFSAHHPAFGFELWRSDGTETGTWMVTEINPGTNNANPTDLIAFGSSSVIFTADDGVHGREIFISDGTPSGTKMLLDITAPLAYEPPTDMILDASGTKVLFTANHTELWITDGTSAGTLLVKDVCAGTPWSPGPKVTWNGLTYFSAVGATNGREPWVSDGTPTGTHILRDIWPGGGGSHADFFNAVGYNGYLYFQARDTLHGTELWKTDGTLAGTRLAADISAGMLSSYPGYFATMGSELYFLASDNGVAGYELHKLDAAGTVSLVADSNPGPGGISSTYIAAGTSKLAFQSEGGSGDRELWISDGTAAGTIQIDIEPGFLASTPTALTTLTGNDIIFSATTLADGTELWSSDMTPAGTQILKDLQPTKTTEHAFPDHLVSVNGSTLYLQADDGIGGAEFWTWSAANGASMLMDIFPGPIGSSPKYFTPLWLRDHQLTFFTARTPEAGTEPWVTDGTAAGTQLLKDINAGFSSSTPESYAEVNGKACFTVRKSSTDAELWASDGTTQGTFLLRALSVIGDFNSTRSNFTKYKGHLYFSAKDDTYGVELWRTDGTITGTQLFKDIVPGFGYSSPGQMTVANGLLMFFADSGAYGYELWASDGTAAGTALAKDIFPGSSDSNDPFEIQNFDFVEHNNLLFFQAQDPTHGYELFVSDGTAAGTKMLLDANPGPGSSSPSQFVEFNGALYYTCEDATNGPGVWRTDGTTAGTYLAAVISSDPISSVTELTPANNGLYFSAHDTVQGTELWFFDGSSVQLACKFLPVLSGIRPENLTLVGGSLIFRANDQFAGVELFRIPITVPYATDLGMGAEGISLTATHPTIGQTITVQCEGVPAGSLSLLVMGAPTDFATAFMTEFGSGSWIDPGSALVLSYDLTENWSYNSLIPAAPGLIGFQFNLQAYILPAATFPAKTSNGLSMVVGS